MRENRKDVPLIPKTTSRLWIWIYGLAAVVMTIAVSVFVWLARESRREAGEGRTAASPAAKTATIPAERFELLARFEAPAYIPDPARDARTSSQFERAMEHYSRQDYAGAIAGLRSAVYADPQDVEARFYLGICFLLTDNRSSGVEELRKVIAAGNARYLERARFYAAKGLLGGGDVRGAQMQLENVISMHGELETEAQAFLVQIAPSR